MNITCLDAPSEIDETVCANLVLAPSRVVKSPRIATVPASFECRTLHSVETGPRQLVVIAEVLYAHICDAFILEAERFHINTPALRLIARLPGACWYSRQTDLLPMPRRTWAGRRASQP